MQVLQAAGLIVKPARKTTTASAPYAQSISTLLLILRVPGARSAKSARQIPANGDAGLYPRQALPADFGRQRVRSIIVIKVNPGVGKYADCFGFKE